MRKQYLILFLVYLSGCYRDSNNYIQQNKGGLLKAYASSTTVPADGKTTIAILASLSIGIDNKTIKFTTNRGVFLDSTLSYTTQAVAQGDSMVAFAYLVAPLDTSSYAYIDINASGIDSIIKISFITAFPDFIHIESSTPAIKTGYGSEASMQVLLTRIIGIPSIHQSVQFLAKTPDDTLIGSFRAISPTGSDQNGLINAIFQLKDDTFTGRIKIIAIFDNGVIYHRDSTYIYVKN